MTVEIWLYSQSQPIVREGVRNTYVKAGFYCVMNEAKTLVEKFPIQHIFMVSEVENSA